MTFNLSDYVAALPKVELHVHLEGSMSPTTLFELASKNKIELPFNDTAALQVASKYKNFMQFANMLLLHSRVLRTKQDFSHVVYRLGQALQRQNVRYAEVIWAPQLHLRKGIPINELLSSMNHGRARVREEFGIEMRWIVDLVRRYPEVASKVQRWASSDSAHNSGIVALGLGGPEQGLDVVPFAPIFAAAKNCGLRSNPHAGEDGDANDIWRAIKLLKADRIGHGIRAVDDPSLLSFLAHKRIPLEVCLTSNLRLSLIKSYRQHPLARLVEAGCLVTLNSDDPGLFHTTLNEEYAHAIENCGLTLEQLRTLTLNGVAASYLPPFEKDNLSELFSAEIARLPLPH